jgi:Anti-sigma-K factor rskA/Putative zinc-finger
MAEHPMPHPDLAGYLFDVLDPDEAHAFETHLAHCGACRAEVDELGRLPALLTTGPAVTMPAELRERTFARIHADPRPVVVGGEVHRQRHPGGRPYTRAGRPETAPPSRPRRPGRLLVVAAALAVLAVTGVVAATLHAHNRPAPAGEIVTLTLVASDDGPQHGMARIEQTPTGRVVHLQVEDLPPPPAGQRYVCWLVGPGDSLQRPNRVAIGSFTPNHNGRADVTLTGAAATDRFPILGVTREPDDGNPQRRGPKVLVTKPPT